MGLAVLPGDASLVKWLIRLLALAEGPRHKGCLLALAEGPRPEGCLPTSTSRLNKMKEKKLRKQGIFIYFSWAGFFCY